MTSQKLALITGGTGGIGSAIARAMASAGIHVALTFRRDEEKARELKQLIEKESGARCEIFQTDITDAAQVDAMLGSIKASFGGVSFLINAASPRAVTASFGEGAATEFDAHFRVNVLASVQLIQKVLPFMKAEKYGVIVSLLTSYVFGAPPQGLAPYVTAKYALLGLTKALAQELGSSGIRVNAVSPGLTETAFTSHIPDAYKQLLARQIPLGRNVTPEDTAAVVRFLCSDEARSITGVNIPVTGGLNM